MTCKSCKFISRRRRPSFLKVLNNKESELDGHFGGFVGSSKRRPPATEVMSSSPVSNI